MRITQDGNLLFLSDGIGINHCIVNDSGQNYPEPKQICTNVKKVLKIHNYYKDYQNKQCQLK